MVKNHLTCLITSGRKPKYICIDWGKEFLSDQSKEWCAEKGIEIQLTAPYSPSQNGVAECMNRTLVELAHAMVAANELPKYLWESTVAHAAYLWNQAYTTTLNNMPYQIWHKEKPNIAHLREFSFPVWILLQVKYVQWKILPKYKQRIFVSYHDGSHSVQYYNAETKTILTSRNFWFLQPALTDPPEQFIIQPDRVEGEPKDMLDNMPEMSVRNIRNRSITSQNEGNDLPVMKRKLTDVNIFELQRTRGKRVDYRQLNDPLPEIDKDIEMSSDIVYASITGDELTSLKDAQRSPEWPQWQKVMETKLCQLGSMNTWQLVDKLNNAILIANKWVFMWKWNKTGEIVRYKARLVTEGFTQWPGHDYNETYAPVIRMDTLRVILALVLVKKLEVYQMDIKGVYLNGILKETIYMDEPKGFNNKTGRVCHLIKTIYGLKQSGRE